MKKKAFGVLLAAGLIVATSGVSMASSANPGLCDGTGGNGTGICTGLCDGTGANRTAANKNGRNKAAGRKGTGSQQQLKDGSGRNSGGIKDRQKLKDGSCLS